VHTEQLPPNLRLGTRTLFCLAAQEREQNFGFRVFLPQTGHAVMAILSEDGWGEVDVIALPAFLRSSLCRDCTVTT
jgi:hypothetical protein